MATELKKKYGLLTAICMVVGIVVGSGVFFKAEAILQKTGGNLTYGIVAWVIGGVIMIISAYTFSLLATKYEKVNGVVDYAEAAVGGKYAYLVGWFLTTIYYPTLTMALAWLSARYTLVVFQGDAADPSSGLCFALACFYLVGSYAMNALSPVLAGKFQVSSTAIKLIPLSLMAIVGTIKGLSNGLLLENFAGTNLDIVNEVFASQGKAPIEELSPVAAIFSAVCATVFAYEGWIIATSINAEIKDAKRNLPKALVIGSIIIVAIYILYYIGLSGAVDNATMLINGQTGAKKAFANVFGNVMGTGIFVFIIVSCLGTLNGLMLGCTRGLYSIASRGRGPAPKIFADVDKNTNMPANSSTFGLLLCAAWLFYFYVSCLYPPTAKILGMFAFDPTELPIITIYPFYIPIFFKMMASKDFKGAKRFIAPLLSVAGCILMVVASVIAHSKEIPGYLIIFAIVMLIGIIFIKEKDIAEAK
ncbi:MAG: APC family permease [Clostridia bacterium]|nr:APC family permease [Clostridia bacterium]